MLPVLRGSWRIDGHGEADWAAAAGGSASATSNAVVTAKRRDRVVSKQREDTRYVEAVSRDPYRVLGVSPSASAEDLHDAYRRLVKLHHPDRNGGSPESTRRFQEIQQAYDELRRRHAAPRATQSQPSDDPAVEKRMADLERELREAQAAREEARRAAREAVHEATGRPSDEELGYVTTDDSFGKILGDVADEVSARFSEARQHPSVRRVSHLIDALEGLSSRFGEGRERRR